MWRCFLVLLTSAMTALAADGEEQGGRPLVGQDGWHPSGLLCYRSGARETTRIHLIRFEGTNIKTMFVKDALETTKDPICLREAVIVISADGTIRKLDLNGDFIFKMKPAGFEGAARDIGKVSERHVFVVETVDKPPKRGLRFRLNIVDVSGREPLALSSYDIVAPYRINRVREQLVVIGENEVQRVNMPKEIVDPKE